MGRFVEGNTYLSDAEYKIMCSHHPPSQMSREDLTLIKWCDDIDHADAYAHQEPPDKEHGYVHRCSLYDLLSPKRVAQPSYQDAAQEATC